MSEYWKSTPSYWCKFCSIYIKDTPLERKNHETSGKHQGAIQKNLRDLTKNKEREQRDQQRAKDEVARLNGLVGGGKASSPAAKGGIVGAKAVAGGGGTDVGDVRTVAQRKAHAEQLLALGVHLPEELKREVTGVGDWQVTSERVVDEAAPATLAEMRFKVEEDSQEGPSQGVRKRKTEDGDDEDEAGEKRRNGGIGVRRYPVSESAGGEDLDALLNGVGKKVKKEEHVEVKQEGAGEVVPPPASADGADREVAIKQEGSTEEAAVPAVVFKKRKVKR